MPRQSLVIYPVRYCSNVYNWKISQRRLPVLKKTGSMATPYLACAKAIVDSTTSQKYTSIGERSSRTRSSAFSCILQGIFEGRAAAPRPGWRLYKRLFSKGNKLAMLPYECRLIVSEMLCFSFEKRLLIKRRATKYVVRKRQKTTMDLRCAHAWGCAAFAPAGVCRSRLQRGRQRGRTYPQTVLRILFADRPCFSGFFLFGEGGACLRYRQAGSGF